MTKQVIVVANKKGGVSKSTIAQNIAYALQKTGKNVKLIDLDPQGSTKDWIEERDETGIYEPISFVAINSNPFDTINQYADMGFSVVVDTAGSDSDLVAWAMQAATQIIVPFRPKRRDYKALHGFVDSLNKMLPNNPDVVIQSVLTQCPSLINQAQRIIDGREYGRASGLETIEPYQQMRHVYDDADEGGATVFEFKYQRGKRQQRDTKAIKEMTEILVALNLIEEGVKL